MTAPPLLARCRPAAPACPSEPLAGLGLKPRHFHDILERRPALRFFEIHAENYFGAGGPFHHYLARIAEHYPLSVHGVGLSIGGADLDAAHLDRLVWLLARYQPAWVSEHLAWSRHGAVCLNDLLPVVYDAATLARVCEHVERVQERLGRRMLLENPATYLESRASTLPEAAFIGEVIRRTGCGLLLDVNNLYVSCINHHRDPLSELAALPLHAVGEIHLAGHAETVDGARDPLLIDNHGAPVAQAVWALYAQAIERVGPMPTLIERDNDIPALDVLLAEARQAERILQDARRNAQALPA
ncbi:MAG TPA: DUF692 domain-containing protein [Immundisolibacter sp.]|nr:DUF692 domain-containing protein [Immundisolibacter sp.]